MAEADPQQTFNVDDAQTDLSTLVERAHAGEEIVLARAGVPFAKLVPYRKEQAASVEPLPRRSPGRFEGLFRDVPDSVWFDPLPEDELDLWEGKHKDFS